MKAFPLSQHEFTDIALRKAMRSAILYVKLYDWFIAFEIKGFLSGWTSRDVIITDGGTAGAAHNHQISLHRKSHG
jgi:hypothetical protein